MKKAPTSIRELTEADLKRAIQAGRRMVDPEKVLASIFKLGAMQTMLILEGLPPNEQQLLYCAHGEQASGMMLAMMKDLPGIPEGYSMLGGYVNPNQPAETRFPTFFAMPLKGRVHLIEMFIFADYCVLQLSREIGKHPTRELTVDLCTHYTVQNFEHAHHIGLPCNYSNLTIVFP